MTPKEVWSQLLMSRQLGTVTSDEQQCTAEDVIKYWLTQIVRVQLTCPVNSPGCNNPLVGVNNLIKWWIVAVV